MATDTELKKLNRKVDEAVNMLKIYIGTSAQVKNTTEKQREAIEKWFDVTSMAEENQKKQRAFTERARDEQGRFLKKQENMSSTFMNMAKSISGTFMGMAKGIGNAITNIASGIGRHLSNLFSAVKSQFLSLFGEESEWFDILSSIKDSITGFFGWFMRGFIFIFRRTPLWANKMIKTLNKMYALQLKQMKMEFLEGTGVKKGGGVWAILGAILFTIAAGLGAWLHRKLVALKLFKVWGKLAKFFAMLEKLPLLGKVVSGLKFGLKWLGWPITVLLSIIDFIKGWSAEMGTWQDKIMTGLNEVIMGFIELPLDLLGWVYDKIMGFFGMEAAGTGDKIKSWFSDFVDLALRFGPIGLITDVIRGFETGDFKGIVKEKMEKIQGIFLSIFDFVADIWNGFLTWAASKVSWIPGIEGITEALAIERPAKPMIAPKSDISTVQEVGKRKIEMDRQQADDLKKSVDAGTQATKDSATKSEGAINAVAAISQRDQGKQANLVDTQQIPDELDNYIMDIKNYGGEFD